MKAFYGSRFSPNMTRTPEEFLICHNVPIARTGWYEYLPHEIAVEGDEIVKVFRSPEEVFSKAAIVSFNGKPVTDEHPPELLTPDNSNIFVKGTTQNVRQDTKEPDLLVADLIIYDSILIEEVLQGKREVSCGYGCNYKPNDDGTYSQIQICGNHIAIVKAGRAGNRIAIKDSKIEGMEGEKKNMSKKKMSTRLFTAMGLKSYLADAEPEEIANAVDEIIAAEKQCDNDPVVEETTNDEGNENTSSLEAKMDKIIELLMGTVKSGDNQPEDVIDEKIEELEGTKQNSIGDEEESVTVPAEEMSDEGIPNGVVQSAEELPKDPLPNTDSAAMIMALKAIKPVIANISNPAEKKKACDSIMAQFNSINKPSYNGYADILNTQRDKALSRQKAADAKQRADEQIGEEIKKRFNPHYKEVK